ncbi:MAG: cytochrome c-type biogenesis protein CcmH [Rhodanobacter sp.]|nr:MAG: cytochrome c-type biogenesis protein CcmH [Rhodanobacter sp.]
MRPLLQLWLVAGLTFAGIVHSQAIEPLPFKNHAEEVRFQHLTGQLRCLVCQNESLADSNAELARDLRLDVFQQMQHGKSDAQIKQYLVARYSDFVLYDPPLKPDTWLLWFGPLLILFGGAVVVAIAIRKRNRDGVSVAAPPTDNGDDW